MSKTGETNLIALIANMRPVLNDGTYVFTTVTDIDAIPRSIPIFEMKEEEGITVVVSKEYAVEHNLTFEYIASWITLNIHSSLEAVGLTAAFSTALGENKISCNVVAGYYHDHIFVDANDAEKAMHILWKMTKK